MVKCRARAWLYMERWKKYIVFNQDEEIGGMEPIGQIVQLYGLPITN